MCSHPGTAPPPREGARLSTGGSGCGEDMANVNWNIAIEAAAVVADDYAERAWSARFPSQEAAIAAEHIAKSIRQLKVDEVDKVNPSIIGGAGDEALNPPPDFMADQGRRRT